MVTLVAGRLQAMGEDSVRLLGRDWSLKGVSGLLLYLLGLVRRDLPRDLRVHGDAGGAAVVATCPAGRRDGGLAVGSDAPLAGVVLCNAVAGNVVYGSLTTAIVVLLSLEIAATLLLLGAQVISEFERIDRPAAPAPANPLKEQQPQASRPSRRLRGADRHRRNTR